MSRLRATDPVRVNLGDCQCPGTPHSEDEAFLPPSLSWEAGVECTAIILSGEPEEVIQRKVSRIFLRDMTWNLTDENGPISPARVDEFSWSTISPIANRASELYYDELLAPFRPVRQKSSPHGQTEASTSPTPPSIEENP